MQFSMPKPAPRTANSTPEPKSTTSTKKLNQIIFTKRWCRRKVLPLKCNSVCPSRSRWHASNQFNNQLKLKLQVKRMSKRSLTRQQRRPPSPKIITKIMSINSNQMRRRAYHNKRNNNRNQSRSKSLAISSIQTSHNRKLHQSMKGTLVISQVPIPTSRPSTMHKKTRNQKKSQRKRRRKKKSQRKVKSQKRSRQKRETSQRKVRKRKKRRMKRKMHRHLRTRN